MSKTREALLREKLLVLRAQNREEGAFRQLVAEYERRLLYYIHRILGSETDRADVLQDIWIRVFLGITKLRAPEAFRVWLYKIAHDVAADELQKRNRREVARLTEECLASESEASDWNELELLEQAQQVHEALGHLSLPHREVLTLRFLEDLELSEIAQIVGCNVGTVKSRLHYAKAAMRQILEDAGRD